MFWKKHLTKISALAIALLLLPIGQIKADEDASLDLCRDAFCQAFDAIDAEILPILQNMTQQNNKNTSDLAEAMPQILRTYRCRLMMTCMATDKFNIEKQDSFDTTYMQYFGCEDQSLTEIKAFGGNAPLENCYISGETRGIIELKNECYALADFKVEQMKIIIPHLLRKDANRKKMGYLAFKLNDLTTRLEGLLMEDAKDFRNKINDILENISCIVDKCN